MLALIPRAIAINLVVGQVVALLKLPIYLDSIGTVLVAVLCGPLVGAFTGLLSNGLAGLLTNPAWLPFAVVAMAIGLVAGGMGSLGAFRSPWTSITAGAFCGVISAACSAPIATYLFGGVTGGGTDAIVALFYANGFSNLAANFMQGLANDPIDKALTFCIVSWALRHSSLRLLQQYPRGLRAVGR